MWLQIPSIIEVIPFQARNRFDGATYAVKIVKFEANPAHFDKVLREVRTLARLDHVNICRYYRAWIEPANSSTKHSKMDEEIDPVEDYESSRSCSSTFSADTSPVIRIGDDKALAIV